VFLEQSEISRQLFELISGSTELREAEAVLAFAKQGDAVSTNDAAAALYRVWQTAKDRVNAQFSELLTNFFHHPQSIEIRRLCGVEDSLACVGALLFTPGQSEQTEKTVRWDVFSNIR
jgi:hypothetical protein